MLQPFQGLRLKRGGCINDECGQNHQSSTALLHVMPAAALCWVCVTPPPPCKVPPLAIPPPPRETVTSMFF